MILLHVLSSDTLHSLSVTLRHISVRAADPKPHMCAFQHFKERNGVSLIHKYHVCAKYFKNGFRTVFYSFRSFMVGGVHSQFRPVWHCDLQPQSKEENNHMSYTVASSIQGHGWDILLRHLHKDAKGTSGIGQAMNKNLLWCPVMGDNINLSRLLCRGSLDFIQNEKRKSMHLGWWENVDIRETKAMESKKNFSS